MSMNLYNFPLFKVRIICFIGCFMSLKADFSVITRPIAVTEYFTVFGINSYNVKSGVGCAVNGFTIGVFFTVLIISVLSVFVLPAE